MGDKTLIIKSTKLICKMYLYKYLYQIHIMANFPRFFYVYSMLNIV